MLCPAAGWEEQLASTEAVSVASAECSWATGVIAGILLIAAVTIVILGASIVILWRRRKHTTKLTYNLHSDCAVGNVADTTG